MGDLELRPRAYKDQELVYALWSMAKVHYLPQRLMSRVEKELEDRLGAFAYVICVFLLFSVFLFLHAWVSFGFCVLEEDFCGGVRRRETRCWR